MTAMVPSLDITGVGNAGRSCIPGGNTVAAKSFTLWPAYLGTNASAGRLSNQLAAPAAAKH